MDDQCLGPQHSALLEYENSLETHTFTLIGQIINEENDKFTWVEIYDEHEPNDFKLIETSVLSHLKHGDFIKLTMTYSPGREQMEIELIEENMYHLFPYSQFRSHQK